MAFCEQCGAMMSDNANFCPHCGARRMSAAPVQDRCPNCGAVAQPGHSFCGQCGSPLGAQPRASVQGQAQMQRPAQSQAAYAQPQPAYTQPQVQQPFQPQPQPAQMQPLYAQPQPAYVAGQASAPMVPANVVPKKMVGKREIPTNRPFAHDELLRFMQERWNVAEYNQIVTDPSMRSYTDRYVVLPATARYMVIVYSQAAGDMFSKGDKVILSIIHTPGGAADMMVRAIPTNNAFFGAAKIAGTLSNKADREGPTEDALQRYADYMHFLLGQAGYLL